MTALEKNKSKTMKDNVSFEVTTGSANLGTEEKLTIEINKMSPYDFYEALEGGVQDFRNNKMYSLLIGTFFALGGLLFLVSIYALKLYIFLNIFLFIFAILGVFVAAAFYEISLCEERGEAMTLGHLFIAISKALTRSEGYFVLGFSVLITMVMWMVIAVIIYLALFDAQILSFSEFISKTLTTGQGWTFLMIGNILGLVFATLLFAMSAFSFQLLYEYNLDVDHAISASIAVISQNIVLMLVWAAIIGASMLGSLVAGFIPLIIIMPLLGYCAWHLYRKAITVKQNG